MLTTVLFCAHTYSANEPQTTVEEDPFSGLVLGQKDRAARSAAMRELRGPRAIPQPSIAAAEARPASGPSLFTLSRDALLSPRPMAASNERNAGAETATASIQDLPLRESREGDVTAGSSRARVIDIPPQMELVELNGVDIVIDGHLDEEAWNKVAGFENMIVVSPDTLVDPEFRTLTRIFYTKRGLYVSADMEQPSDSLVQRLSARDQDLNRDGFGITLDTSGKGLFGFWFSINLGGSKEDGKVLPERNFSSEWDGAWSGATTVTETGWTAELFIPWSIVAMPPEVGKRNMSFFVSRKVAFRNERYGWPALPFTQARFMSAMQPMAMEDVNPTQQWELFPYATTSADAIYDEMNRKVGLNFSWRPAPNLQVSGAANPDFGAVESDDVVVNLTAYETFFPEKRLFFLEGSEVFETTPRGTPFRGSSRGGGARVAPSTYNMEPTTLLNTRRIGGSAKHLDYDDAIDVPGPERSKPTDLLGAVKVVGQASAFRFGFLGAMEDDVELRGTMERMDETGEMMEEDVIVSAPGRDFGVARLLWERQSGTGRQAHGLITTFADTPEYGAVVTGLDSHFLTQNGKWNIDSQIINSRKDSETGYGAFADIRYTPKQGIFHRLSLDFLDDTLDVSDLGFLRRNDLRGFRYTRFHNTSRNLPDIVRSRSIGLFLSGQTNANGDLIRGYLGTGVGFYFTNQSAIDVQLSIRPKMVDDRSSFGKGSFEMNETKFFTITYGSDSSKKFSYSLQTGVIDEDLGDPAYIGDIGFTYSPLSRLRFDYDLRYRDSEGWLLYSGDTDFTRYYSEQLSHLFSTDFFISAKQQFRATLQWTGINATQRDFWRIHDSDQIGQLESSMDDPDPDSDGFTISRLTAQVRYRWEIAPLSDLFIVYTRGSNLPSLGHAEFGHLFREALSDPIVDVIVVKLRYRFGS